MDEELREAERKWKAFYEGKPYIIKQLGEITGKELENGWEIAYEDKKSIWHPPSHQHSSIKIGFIGHWGPGRQETWGNPNAATKAAKRYIRRMGFSLSRSNIKVVRIGNYKFQPRVYPAYKD